MITTRTKARYLADQIVEEINNDPIQLLKIGCNMIELSDQAMVEIVEHAESASELTNINYEKYFKQLLFEVIKGYKGNGKKN